MRVVVGALVACAAGCGNLLGIDNFSLGDAGAGDGVMAGDSGTAHDGTDVCYGPTGWQLCFATPPTGAVTLASGTFSTDTNPACAPGNPWSNAAQPLACVVAGSTVTVTGTVVAVGVRPLVLLSTDTIDITGTLDIASHVGGTIGPGTRAACNPFGTAPGNSNSGAGGGAGGSFTNSGGNGGKGAGGGVAGGTTAASLPVPDTLLGGCPGQTGGMDNGGDQGVFGPGGGAVFIVATTGLTISGTINASGAGGGGGKTGAGGGGGGGSGGTILIYTPTISATGATLIANGGGGGGEGTGVDLNGADPDPAQPENPASGGVGTVIGGSGYAYEMQATAGGNANITSGGGGGGGGAGTIDTNVSAPGGVIPGATTSPVIDQLF